MDDDEEEEDSDNDETDTVGAFQVGIIPLIQANGMLFVAGD